MAAAYSTRCVVTTPLATALTVFLLVLAAMAVDGEPGPDAASPRGIVDCMTGCGMEAAGCGMEVAECAVGCVNNRRRVAGAGTPVCDAACGAHPGNAVCLACRARAEPRRLYQTAYAGQ